MTARHDEAARAEATPTGEVQRYRVHLLITATGFRAPESLRVDCYAASHDDARDRAVIWARLQPLMGMTCQVLSVSQQDGETGVAPLTDSLRERMEQELWGTL
jgi:hypothetical protein